jgi:hypothetical protein
MGGVGPAWAALHAPDTVLYGIVAFGSNQLSALDNQFTVEASANGFLVAQYRMGEKPEAQDFYVLSIYVEEMEPRRDLASVLPGDALTVAVLSNGVQKAQQTVFVQERGEIKRLDFAGLPPTNQLTGFALWASQLGLSSESQAADADGDRISNLAEYIAGTSPKDPAEAFVLRTSGSSPGTLVSFQARKAAGPGYEGLTRHYRLQQAASCSEADWQTVPGYEDVEGANQEINYQRPANSGPTFFRGVVWLSQSP